MGNPAFVEPVTSPRFFNTAIACRKSRMFAIPAGLTVIVLASQHDNTVQSVFTSVLVPYYAALGDFRCTN